MKNMWMGLGVCVLCFATFILAMSSPGRGQVQVNAVGEEKTGSASEVACWELIRERERALCDLAASQARLEFIAKMRGTLQAELDKEIAGDAMLANLEARKTVLENRLKALRTSQAATPDEISGALINLAEIPAVAAVQRERLRGASHDGAFSLMSRATMDATIEVHSDQARLDHIAQRLVQLPQEQAKH